MASCIPLCKCTIAFLYTHLLMGTWAVKPVFLIFGLNWLFLHSPEHPHTTCHWLFSSDGFLLLLAFRHDGWKVKCSKWSGVQSNKSLHLENSKEWRAKVGGAAPRTAKSHDFPTLWEVQWQGSLSPSSHHVPAPLLGRLQGRAERRSEAYIVLFTMWPHESKYGNTAIKKEISLSTCTFIPGRRVRQSKINTKELSNMVCWKVVRSLGYTLKEKRWSNLSRGMT